MREPKLIFYFLLLLWWEGHLSSPVVQLKLIDGHTSIRVISLQRGCIYIGVSDAIRVTSVRSCMDDLINSYRLPSPKFDALHDMYIVLSSVQTNFEAILSYIYIYSRGETLHMCVYVPSAPF